MEKKNAKRSSEFKKEPQDSQLETRSRSLGTVSRPSRKDGSYKVRVSRENSNESNYFVRRKLPSGGISGKALRQLVDETEKQLAFYEQQAEALRVRLEELKQIPGIASHIDKTD